MWINEENWFADHRLCPQGRGQWRNRVRVWDGYDVHGRVSYSVVDIELDVFRESLDFRTKRRVVNDDR